MSYIKLCNYLKVSEVLSILYYPSRWAVQPATPVGDMFKRKTDEKFKEVPNALGIADNIFIAGYDENDRDHDNTLRRELQICREV